MATTAVAMAPSTETTTHRTTDRDLFIVEHCVESRNPAQRPMLSHAGLMLLYLFRKTAIPAFWAISSAPTPGVHSEDPS